ncbi:type I secretion C-terminal target domain-containing protein, partial [Aestuariirhabdus sp. Z084]|uniref:beta strand repeat-containing protein n=1 Tax=Aestuariirhabdus haliotis TaxID=2918751 RepID=UPI00201B368A
DSFTYTITDADGDTSTAVVTINVGSVDDQPVIDTASGTTQVENLATAGDTVATFTASDGDGDAITYSITSGNLNGYFEILDPNSGVVTLTAAGETALANDALTDTDYILGVTANDGSVDSAEATVTVTFAAVNDAPVNTIPASQTVEESQSLSITGLAINDLDDNGGQLTTTLSVSNGVLTVGSLGGALVSGSGTSSVTLTGTEAEINAVLSALDNVSYQGNSNFSGNDTLQISTNDQGNTGTGGALSDTDAVTIVVSEDVPEANSDLQNADMLDGVLTVGNVISGLNGGAGSADTIDVDGPLSIQEFSFTNASGAVETKSFVTDTIDGTDATHGDFFTVQTQYGELNFYQDGFYSYDPDVQLSYDFNNTLDGAELYGFDTDNGFRTADLVLDANGVPTNANATISISNNGVGVTGNPDGNQIGAGGGDREFVVINLGINTTSATINFNNYSGNDDVRIIAYREDGTVIGSINRDADPLTVTSADFGENFYYLAIGADDNNDEYYIDGITINPAPVYAGDLNDQINYTVVDNDGDTDTSTLTLRPFTDATAISDTAMVSEEGLANGTLAGDGSDVATGNLLANDAGIGASTSITEVEGNLADANGVIVVTTPLGELTVYTQDFAGNLAGDYEYVLNNNSLAGDGVTETFNYVLNNGNSADLTVSVTDDAPVVSNIEQNLATSADPITTNLTFVLDLSGSMNNPAGNGQSYLETAVESLSALIREVDDIGNVNVQIVTFSSAASSNGWQVDDVEGALNYLESLVANGGTAYDAALDAVMASGPLPTADQSLVYFISDGAPNSGNEVDAGQQTLWENYLDANYDLSFGIGIGNAPLGELEPIAYPEVNGVEEYAVVVDDASDLTSTVLEYFTGNAVTGSIGLLGTAGTGGLLVGADGGIVSAIVIDGVTYNYDVSSPQQTYNTALGGVLQINFETGEYNYSIELDRNVLNQHELFSIEVTDGDGDSDTFDLKLNIDYYASLDANADNIISNLGDGSTVEIPLEFLMHNDSVPPNTSITGVTPNGSTDASIVGDSLVIGTVSNGDRFDYTLEGNGATDSTHADVALTSDSSLTGTQEGDILVSGSTSTATSAALLQAQVKSGNTYLATNQFGFTLAAASAGLWVSSISIDLRAGGDGDAFFDTDQPGDAISIDSDTSGIGSQGNIFSTVSGDQPVITANFEPNDFTVGDEFWFSVDVDNLGTNFGDSLADGGATVTVTMSDGSTQTVTYSSDGAGGSTANVLIQPNIIDGQGGDDVLISGAGNDILIGGEGQDIFAWLTSDASNPQSDVVQDFSDADGDILDLSHLLEGATAATLDDYLSVAFSATDTTISVDADGLGSDGTSVNITLSGWSQTDWQAVYSDLAVDGGGQVIGSDLIAKMLDDGKLNIDS